MLKKRNRTITLLLFALCFMISSNISQFYFGNYNDISIREQNMDPISDINVINDLKAAANEPNGKTLFVIQHANTSNSFLPFSLPTNISFTLAQGWISKNITINYEGVASENNTVSNGDLASNRTGWTYKSNNPGELVDKGWTASEGNPPGCFYIEIQNDALAANDYGYCEQTTWNGDNFATNYLTTISMNYKYNTKGKPAQSNVSTFLEVEIGGVKANKTIEFPDLVQDAWSSMYLTYDPSAIGQTLPNNITVRAGIFVENGVTPSDSQELYIDNIKYKIWSGINDPDLIVAYDIDYNKNYTYNNITAGKGTTFIEIERNRSVTSDVIFTISKNSSYSDEFSVKDITISSKCIKLFNSTYGGLNGSYYTTDGDITWNTEFSIFIPYDYVDNWAELEKPSDWTITSVLDGYNTEQKGSCSGIGIGSETLIIPKGALTSGLWKIEAINQNYINSGKLGVWNGTIFNEQSLLTISDIFQVNITLNDTISLTNTRLNCTIKYPNGTIFWQDDKEPSSPVVTFGNFTAGTNMSVGDYQVIVEWTNNNTYLMRDQVGFAEFSFTIWHHSNFTAINSYLEIIGGDPLLLKVKYIDSDLNDSIDFATVTYNSTYGGSGTMPYIGLGEYFAEIDTSSLNLTDYYFSFHATKTFYENQTAVNLIHLKIIAQPLALEVPSAAINAMANSYAICQVNVTGAISGVLLSGDANMTTDWDNPYQVINHANGTFTLNFSTIDIPTQGVLESFTITVFANKTDYGATTGFITLIVNPIQTIADANKSIVNAYLNEVIDLKVNYTIEGSSELISGANCSVEWQGASNIVSVADGFIVSLDTNGLSINSYTALIKFEHVGYANAFKSLTIIISGQNVNLKVVINSIEVSVNSLVPFYYNEVITLSCRASAALEQIYLSGGTITFINAQYEQSLVKYDNSWFNTSIPISTSTFSLGINYVYIEFQQDNYTTTTFSFQILVNQIEFDVQTIGFQDSIEVNTGEKIQIRINLTESGTTDFIENATISYRWDYGVGEFEEVGNGIYEIELVIPENIGGNYKITLIISKEGTVYKSTESSFLLAIKVAEFPVFIIWIIIIISAAIISVLGILSLRAYVILPKRRGRETELISKVQVYKDVWNIRAVILIHKLSGLPIYSEDISIMGMDHDSTLISGFIQAITAFSESLVDKEFKTYSKLATDYEYLKTIIDLDFKFFQLLVCDFEAIRVLLILRDSASERLKKQLYLLASVIYSQFSKQINKFSGSLSHIHNELQDIINRLLFLHYNGEFEITPNRNYYNSILESGELTTLERRLINVISSMIKINKTFTLKAVIDLIDEIDEDLVLEALNSLISRKIILSPYSPKLKQKKSRV